MHTYYGLWIALGLIVLGSLLFSYAFSMLPDPDLAPSETNRLNDPLSFMLCLWFGFFFMGTPLAYISVKTTKNPPALSAVDWALILFVIFFMPIFQVVGLSLHFWISTILFPTFSFRVLLKLYAKGLLKKAFVLIAVIVTFVVLYLLLNMSLPRFD